MDAIAVELAKSRLAKTNKALAALKAATNYEQAEEAWTDFLLAAATIYSKLEQGSKGDGKSRGWFGQEEKERRDDPLLRYLHYARNSDEHGIERVAGYTGDNYDLGGRKLRFNERIPYQAQQLDKVSNETFGEKHEVVLAGPTLKPIRVHDRRFNDYCDPPDEHQGKHVRFSSFVIDIVEAAIPYLTELVSEAEALASNSKNIAT